MTLDILPSTILRLLLAFIFLRAAWHKANDIPLFITQLRDYHLLPERCLSALACALVLLETYLAGTLPVPASALPALIAAALLSLYASAIAINLLRDRRDLDCGCGGAAAIAHAISWALVARNGMLASLALAAALPVASRAWSLLDAGSAVLASIAACLLYCSIEQAILNGQRALRYVARAEHVQ